MKTNLSLFIMPLIAAIACISERTNAQNTSPYWSQAGNSNATSGSKLGTTNAIDVRMFTNNVERMRINSKGNVGIGTASATDRLQVNSASGANAFRAQVNGSTKLLVHSGGGVTIGSNTAPPANGLYVSGSVGIGTPAPNPLNKVEVLIIRVQVQEFIPAVVFMVCTLVLPILRVRVSTPLVHRWLWKQMLLMLQIVMES